MRGMGNVGPAEAVRRDFYTYQSQVVVASGARAVDIINIEADSEFWATKMAYLANDAAAITTQLSSTRIIPNVVVLITDTGSGRQLMSQPVPISSIAGTGELPFILPAPRYFMPNSSITIAYENFDSADDYALTLQFIGYKTYNF